MKNCNPRTEDQRLFDRLLIKCATDVRCLCNVAYITQNREMFDSFVQPTHSAELDERSYSYATNVLWMLDSICMELLFHH